MSNKHIVVIGGGVIGACTTYYLSRNNGLRITVIEKTGIACNASGKAGGFLAYNWSDDTSIGDLSRRSFQLHGELATELDGENKYGFRKVDTFSVLYQGGKSGANTKQEDMDVIAWIDASGVRHMEKLGNKTDTAQIQPRLFTETLFETAKQTGNVTLRTGFGVSHVIIDDDQIRGVQLDNGEIINSDSVVICMGAWSGQLPTLQLPIDGQRAHSIVFKPKNPVPAQMLFTTILDSTRTHHPEVYPRPDGTVYMCGATDNTKLPSSADQIQVEPQAIRELERLRDTLAPDLYDGDKLIAQQACYLPVSEDGTAFVGPHPKYKKLIIAAGHSCWGILQAPATGLMISELLVNGRISCVDREAVEALDPTNRC